MLLTRKTVLLGAFKESKSGYLLTISSTKDFLIVSYLLQDQRKCTSFSTSVWAAVLTNSQMLREFTAHKIVDTPWQSSSPRSNKNENRRETRATLLYNLGLQRGYRSPENYVVDSGSRSLSWLSNVLAKWSPDWSDGVIEPGIFYPYSDKCPTRPVPTILSQRTAWTSYG